MARILIVEDEPDIALGLVDDLTREGYQVETAATGPEGLKRARGEAWERRFGRARRIRETPRSRARVRSRHRL